jgi:hypothetical protein
LLLTEFRVEADFSGDRGGLITAVRRVVREEVRDSCASLLSAVQLLDSWGLAAAQSCGNRAGLGPVRLAAWFAFIARRREAVPMSVSADSFDKLSEKIDEAKRTIRAAASETEAELKAKVDEARKNADDRAAALRSKTAASAGQAEGHWQQIQSDWEEHRQSVRRRIDQAKANEKLEDAELRAEWAEADARDAIEFAANAIDEAKYALLDAVLARKDVSVLMKASS